jgi:hypothetical protein
MSRSLSICHVRRVVGCNRNRSPDPKEDLSVPSHIGRNRPVHRDFLEDRQTSSTATEIRALIPAVISPAGPTFVAVGAGSRGSPASVEPPDTVKQRLDAVFERIPSR